MVKSEPEVGFSTYQSIDMGNVKLGRKSKTLQFGLVAVTLVAAVCAIAFVSSRSGDASFESLAAPDTINYGEYITLKNVYNEYLLVGHSGRAYTGGYHASYDRIQILSASASQGAVNYGDKVLLVGQNDKYFAVKDSGVVTCRFGKSSPAAEFQILGGSGPVTVGDRVEFKTFFGWLTATREGVHGDTEELTSMEKYGVGRPGQEDGVHSHQPLRYGMAIELRNRFNEYLQTGPNGWVFIRSNNGPWNHFDVLSPLHRQGNIRYGDKVILRGHNGNMVMARDGGLTAWQPGAAYHTVFELIGGNGLIHAGDAVALRAPAGFVNAEMAGKRADVDTSGHYNPTQNFEVVFADTT